MNQTAAQVGPGYAVLQTVLGFCEVDDQSNTAYQFHLSWVLPHGQIVNGTASLTVLVSWNREAHAADSLRFLAFPPDDHSPAFDEVSNGEPVEVFLEGFPVVAGQWDLWLCTIPVTASNPLMQTAFPFVGDITVKVEMNKSQA